MAARSGHDQVLVFHDVVSVLVLQVGCPVLALEVLSKIPKVTKKSGSSPLSKASSKANLNSSQPLENGTQAAVDWAAPAAPAWGGSDSVGGLDWSQPLVKVEEDELKLDWGDDKQDEDEDEDEDDGLTMKKPELETKAGGGEGGGAKLQRADSQVRYDMSVIRSTFIFICGSILLLPGQQASFTNLSVNHSVDKSRINPPQEDLTQIHSRNVLDS